MNDLGWHFCKRTFANYRRRLRPTAEVAVAAYSIAARQDGASLW